LLGAVEYSKVLPSVNMPIGVRFPNGIEFGLGPQLSFAAPKPVNSAPVMAAGKTFLYKGVGLPVNLAVVKGSGGYSAAFMFGYAIVKTGNNRPGNSAP
jgi:hypothetical protein